MVDHKLLLTSCCLFGRKKTSGLHNQQFYPALHIYYNELSIEEMSELINGSGKSDIF